MLDHAGAFLTVHAMLPAGTTPPRTPLLISALRANAFRLAGEIADGAISWMCPISYLAQTARPALGSGAAAAGRSTPPLIAHVPVAMHTEREAVRAAATSEDFKAAMEKVSTPVSYLDAPEFQKYWDKDAARLKAALEKIGKVEEK